MRVSQFFFFFVVASMSQSDFYIFSKDGYFFFPLSLSVSSSLQPRISGQRLMMQRRYCAFAVEQKKGSATVSFLGPH